MGVGRERLGKVGKREEGRDRERGRERGRERKGMGSRERGEWKREGGLGREEMGRQRKGMARAAGRLGRDAERERERFSDDRAFNNNSNVQLSCAHQRPERSYDTY